MVKAPLPPLKEKRKARLIKSQPAKQETRLAEVKPPARKGPAGRRYTFGKGADNSAIKPLRQNQSLPELKRVSQSRQSTNFPESLRQPDVLIVKKSPPIPLTAKASKKTSF